MPDGWPFHALTVVTSSYYSWNQWAHSTLGHTDSSVPVLDMSSFFDSDCDFLSAFHLFDNWAIGTPISLALIHHDIAIVAYMAMIKQKSGYNEETYFCSDATLALRNKLKTTNKAER